MSIEGKAHFYKEIYQAYKEQTPWNRRVQLKGNLRMSFIACTKSKKTAENPHTPSEVNQGDKLGKIKIPTPFL